MGMTVTLTQLKAVIEALRACKEDLCAEINARYEGALDYPIQERRYQVDMDVVRGADYALANAPALLAVMEKLFSEPSDEMIEAVARGICQERCAQMGETPCYTLDEYKQNCGTCDGLSKAAILRWQKEAGVK